MALSRKSENRAKQLANLKPFTGVDDPRRSKDGRPKSKPFLEAIQKHIKEHPEDVEAVIRAAFQQSKRGSVAHLRELADRVDGPVTTKQEITGADGGPIEHTIKFGDNSGASNEKPNER